MSSPTPENSPSPREKRVFIVLFAGFVLTGVVTTILGPSLPILMARWSLNDVEAGDFFTTLFLGSLAGVGSSSVLLAWKGYRPALASGFAMMALGMAGLDSPAKGVALLGTAAFGFGFGAVSSCTNLRIGETAGSRRSAALNILNVAWSIGALGCPPLVFAAVRSNSFGTLLYGIAGVAGALALIVLLMPLEPPAVARGVAQTQAERPAGFHAAFALGGLFFLYVGTEAGISGWAAAHAKRIEAASGSVGSLWTLAPMFLWVALLLGRGLAPLILRRVKENRLAVAGLGVAAAGTALLLQATSQIAAMAGVLIAGFGLSSLYPIFIAWLSKSYGVGVRRMGGIFFALAALGGSTMPWLVGFISTRVGSLRVGLVVPLAGCFAMAGMLALFRRQRLV
jgi:fucose permease